MHEAVAAALEGFVTRLWANLEPGRFAAVLSGDQSLVGAHLDHDPQSETMDHLVVPLLEAVGLTVETPASGSGPVEGVLPSVRITNLHTPLVGTVAPLGNISAASRSIETSIGPFRTAAFGIATDGEVWRLHRAETRGDTTGFPVISGVDLRSAMLTIAVNQEYLSSSALPDFVTVDESTTHEAVPSGNLESRRAATGSATGADRDRRQDRPEPAWAARSFVDQFGWSALEDRLRAAPRDRRERRERAVETFYDRYVELLFGEGTHHSVETPLIDAISPPPEADPPAHERRLFALCLANRLLVVSLLEGRGVIEDGSLVERVRHHDASNQTESLYERVFRPLLSDPLHLADDAPPATTPQSGRLDPEQPLRADSVFGPAVPGVHAYDVDDDMLRTLVCELVQHTATTTTTTATDTGTGIDTDTDSCSTSGTGTDTLDPAILGSVFEKVINHLGAKADVGLQKEELGAIYTPSDITERIVGRTVEPAIKDALITVLLDHVDAEDPETRTAIRSSLHSRDLGELLGHFAMGTDPGISVAGEEVVLPVTDPGAIDDALAAVSDITVLDPACGSGHFLTVAMDRLHRAQVRLLRGANGGDDPSPADRYEAKRALAVSSVYGVDVHAAAVDVARLRVLLKVLADHGWADSTEPLPTVEANVVHGNALVGLPVTGPGQDDSTVPQPDPDKSDVRRRRESTVDNDPSDHRSSGSRGRDVPGNELDAAYLSRVACWTVEKGVTHPGEFRRIVDAIPSGGGLSTHVKHVQARPQDGGEFTAGQRSTLEDAGFDISHTGTTANMDVEAVERRIETSVDGAPHRLADQLETVLAGPVRFATVTRRPLPVDLAAIEGRPFHWIAEFPEVVTETDAGPTVEFDVILGNPPYGDLLNDAEKRLLSHLHTGDGYAALKRGEIAGNFIERQLDLLAPDGYFGNIVTVGVLSSSDRRAEHALLAEGLDSARISSFARRPAQVFTRAGSRVEINPTIITGRPSRTPAGRVADDRQTGSHRSAATIQSSDFVRFDPDTRYEAVTSHELGSTAGLSLRDRMGGERCESGFDVFPKVGDTTKRDILLTLADAPQQVGDWEVEDSPYVVRHRRSFNYWLVATRGGDDLANMREYAFPDRVTRDFVFLAANSSLLYAYHMTYGNMQDFGKARFRRFPVPARETLVPWKPLVHAAADAVEVAVDTRIESPGDADYEGAPAVKPTVDESEFLLGWIYDLTVDEIAYLQRYDAEFARCGPPGYDPTVVGSRDPDRGRSHTHHPTFGPDAPTGKVPPPF